jgi:methylmalonyl-CoA mutase N-terminal domain/subunit
VALRTQQLIAYESRVPQVVDPLGGSYFVEALTAEVERQAQAYIDKIDELGGIARAVELGFPQKEIAESAYRFQRAVEEGRETIVGVNRFATGEETKIPTLKIEPEVERAQVERIKAMRAKRDAARCDQALQIVRKACESKDNLMPPILDAVRASATVGEISQCFRDVFGEYHDPAYC